MKQESTIFKIDKELISTFASFDAWFDKILDDGCDSDHSSVLQHIISSNYHLLDLLTEGYDYAMADFKETDRRCAGERYYPVRFALRDQLYQCLCLLDDLGERTADTDAKEMNAHDRLISLIHHLQYHLAELEDADAPAG